jgi:hypothetical protein
MPNLLLFLFNESLRSADFATMIVVSSLLVGSIIAAYIISRIYSKDDKK